MAAELTKVYKTSDGRHFERDDRDAARQHEAWLELVQWVGDNMTPGDGDAERQRTHIAHEMARSHELLEILKRKPTEAAPP